MDFLDVPTLMQVTAVFNGMAALVWLMLSELFRLAPRASRLMAAAHLVRIASQGGWGFSRQWPVGWDLALVCIGTGISVLLMALALRRMLRLPLGGRPMALLAGASAVLMLAALLAGPPRAAAGVLSLLITVLALMSALDLWRGMGRLLRLPLVAGMALPYLTLSLMGAYTCWELLAEPARWDAYFLERHLPAADRALAWLLVTALLTLSLMAQLIWRLVARIQHLTLRDPLTGTLNRRAFEQRLGELQQQRARGHGFALVMMDIDHFKRVNDLHGHAAGDAALKHAVAVWQGGLREVDALGRLGGEEFCALLPQAEADTARAVAERLRAALEATPPTWHGQALPLTASFGVAVASGAGGPADLARADAHLYRAKAEGRNRVCGLA